MIRQLAVLAGAGTGLGLTLVTAALLPAEPQARGDTLAAADVRVWRANLARLATHLPAVLTRPPLLRASNGDLDLVGYSRERLLTSKLGMTALGLVAAPALTLILHIGGIHPPVGLPVAATIALAAAGFQIPDLDVRRRADRARVQFTRAVGLYLILVALERRADASPTQALLRAAQVGRSWVWVRIRDALDRAHLDRRPAWDGLADLAAEVGVPQLNDVADIMRSSGAHGTAVHQTLLARARSLRTELTTRYQTEANADSERMVVPVALLGLAFVALLAYPVFSRIAFG